MGDPNSEVGWEEFDDISELGVSADAGDASPAAAADADVSEEPTEIGFEEVDAATLAELGIVPDEVEGTAAAAGPARTSARSTRARTPRGRTPDATTEADEPAAPRRARGSRAKPTTPATTDDKPRRATRSRTPKATAEPAGEEKPKRSTRARAPKAADASAGDGGEGAPEGIWQRFRSGRTSS